MAAVNPTVSMTLPRAPTHEEIVDFINTLTDGDIARLLQNGSEPAEQGNSETAMVANNPVQKKNPKALNAFVAYRCYYIYCALFKTWPMKKLSNVLGKMWEADPNKHLWSLMAKTWSTMRDQVGKKNVPLNVFFAIVCPYLDIPDPERYLKLFGYTLNVDNDGLPVLCRDETTPVPDEVIADMGGATLSVDDIIEYAQSKGYGLSYIHVRKTSTFQVDLKKPEKEDVSEALFCRRLALRLARRARRYMALKAPEAQALRAEYARLHALADFVAGDIDHLPAYVAPPPLVEPSPLTSVTFALNNGHVIKDVAPNYLLEHADLVTHVNWDRLDEQTFILFYEQFMDFFTQYHEPHDAENKFRDDDDDEFDFNAPDKATVNEETFQLGSDTMSSNDEHESAFRTGADEDVALPNFYWEGLV